MKKIIALAIVLLGAFTYVTMNSFTLYVQMPQNGFIIEQANVLETLEKEDTTISVESVTKNDEIYKRNNNLYLNKSDFKFTESLPMVLNNTEVTYFFDESSVLLANDFYQTNSFKGMYLSCGISFDSDYTQADYEEWILARMYDGSYMNAQLIKVTNATRTVYIENSSFIDFNENSITYNTILEDGSIFSETIDYLTEASISLGQNKFNYTKFYEYLKMSEEDSSFTISEDEITKDSNMPSTKADLEGGAKLTESADGKYVEIDKSTVVRSELIAEESSIDRSDDIGGQSGKPREEGNEKDQEDEEETTDIEDPEKIEEEEENPDEKEKETKIEINIPTGDQQKDDKHEEKEPGGEGGAPEENDIIIVKIEDFEPWVYTAGTTGIIYDGGNRMVGNVKFVVTNEEGETVARKIASSSGEIVLNNLPPDSKLTIKANYRYKEKDGLKYETGKNGIEDAFVQTIHTLPLSQVEPIDVSFTPSTEIYSNSAGLLNISMKNRTDFSQMKLNNFEKSKYNSISFVSYFQIEFTRTTDGKKFVTNLPTSYLSRLKAGESFDYITDEVLDSKGSYTYEISLVDRYGNKMKTSPASLTGSCVTRKITPSATFKIENNEAGSITVKHVITDIDNAIVKNTVTNSNYRYRIKNEEGLYTSVRAVYTDSNGDEKVQSGESLKFNDNQYTLTFTNLPYSNYLTLELYADIDIGDEKGLQNEQLISSFSFYSAGIVSGSLTYTSSYTDVGGTNAVATFRMANGSNLRLASLMTDFRVTFTSDDGDEKRVYTIKANDLKALSVEDGTLNYDGEGVVIQAGSEKLKEPRIKLVGPEEAFTENAWQTFINGASKQTDVGSIEIKFPAQSLSPSTTYYVEVESLIDQGLSFYRIETINRNNQFTTLKREPVVHNAVDIEIINNTATLTDIYITDIDNTIVEGPVSVELIRDKIVYDSFEMQTGIEHKATYTFSNLMKQQKYTIKFKAKGYNNGNTDLTLKTNESFYEIEFVSDSNINGSLEVGELNKKPVQMYSGDVTTYAGVNLLDDKMNMMANASVQEGIVTGYYNYANGNLVENVNYFASDYIEVNKKLPLTFLFRNFSITSYYGNYLNGEYFGNMTFYFSFFEYNSVTNKYTYLGYTTVKGRGDYYDATTLSYANRITHIKVSGMAGYENLCKLYQGIQVLDEIDNADYEKRETETVLNGYGEYTINTSYTTIPYYGLEVHPGDIYYSKDFGNGINCLAFYDSDGNVIQTMNYYSAGGYRAGKPVEGNLFVVPNNAVSMIVSWTNSGVNNPIYYLKRLSTSEEMYQTTLDVFIEDLNKVFTKPTKFKLVSKVGTDIYDPSNHAALVEFKPDEVKEFFTGEEKIRQWEYGSLITLDLNTYYYFELYLIMGDHEVLLDTAEIYTESDWDFIYTWDDFSKIMHDPLGQYKVMADIVMPTYWWQQPSPHQVNHNRISVEGVLDFNGHSFTPASTYWGFDVGLNGTLKNMIILHDYPGMEGEIDYGAPIYTNNGTVENVIVQYNTPLKIRCNNSYFAGLCYNNAAGGVLKNCAIIVNSDLTFERTVKNYYYASTGVCYNSGKMYNCYIASSNTSAIYLTKYEEDLRNSGIYFGALVYRNENTGLIENCYSAVEVYQRQGSDLSSWSSNFVNYDVYGATIKNSFAVGNRNEYIYYLNAITPTGIKLNAQVPCLSRAYGQIVLNSYYFSGDGNKYTGSTFGFDQGDIRNLMSVDWYTGTLGFVEGEYQIKDPVNLGYYPRLNFPSFMAAYQPFISIATKYSTNMTMRVIDVQILAQTNAYADAKVYIYNPNKYLFNEMKVEGVECTISGSYYDADTLTTELTIHLASPSKYLSSYNIISISYLYGKLILNFTSDVKIPCEFYRPISTASDWSAYVQKDPSQNYRLTGDINFEGVKESAIFVSRNFTGKLDGTVYDHSGAATNERYSLKNITLGESYCCVIYSIPGGSITNLIVDNMTISPTIKKTDYTGFIYTSENSNTVIDNVTVMNSNIKGAQTSGLLIANCRYLKIRNCSVIDSTLYDYLPSGTYNGQVCFGGLVGRAYWCDIDNCFVYGININVAEVKLINAVGGMVGYAERVRMSNIYTHGYISNYSSNTGGVVGRIYTSRITNGFTYITLEGSDIIGGVVGKDDNNDQTNKTSSSVYRNLISFGDIYIKSESYTDVHRLFGTAMNYGDNVYAYASQKVVPAIEDNSGNKDDAKRLVASMELTNPSLYQYEVDMGDAFDYSTAKSAIIPQLFKYESNERLPDQRNIYVTLEGVSARVEDAYRDSESLEEIYVAKVVVSHPVGYTVKASSVTLNDMELIADSNALTVSRDTSGKSTYITIRSHKKKALDTYTMNFTLSAIDPKNLYTQAMSLQVSYSKTGAIYWEISNYSQWKETMRNHGYNNENFKITGVIDFAEESDTFLTNLMVNRLIGTGEGVIKNVNILADSTTGFRSLFQNITSEVNNLIFEDIKINVKEARGSINNYGLICQTATAKDITVRNFTLEYANWGQTNYVGFIGRCYGNVINLDVDGVYIFQANSAKNNCNYIGTIGCIDGGFVNCDFTNVTVSCPRNGYNYYVGTACGYSNGSYIEYIEINRNTVNETDNYSIKVNNSKVTGYTYVGGAIGGGVSRALENIFRTQNGVYVDGVKVDGYCYVGGVIGYDYPCQYNVCIKNSEVNGDYAVGGINGYITTQSCYHYSIENTKVNGIFRVGLLAGTGYGYVYGIDMKDSEVVGNKAVAGLVGFCNNYGNIRDVLADNITITGEAVDSATYEAYQIISMVKEGFDTDGSCVGFVNGYGNNYYYCIDLACANLTNIKIKGTYDVGGYYGMVRTGYLCYCASDMDVQGDRNVGGVIGRLKQGYYYYNPQIRQCYVQGTVSGDDIVAGFCGAVEHYDYDTKVIVDPQYYGFLGQTKNAANNDVYYSYSDILNLSITCDTNNASFYCNEYNPEFDTVASDSKYLGSVDYLRYMDTCEISKNGSAYTKITNSTIPTMYQFMDPSKLAIRQAEIFTSEDLLDFAELYHNKAYGGLNLDHRYFLYLKEYAVTEYPFLVTKTAADSIEISGLGAGQTYDVTLEHTDNELSDEGLLLYYDSKNNTGEGIVDKESTVWKNLGTLGSDYDMTIYTNHSKLSGSDLYEWTDNNGLYIKPNSVDKSGNTTGMRNNTWLTTDEETGRLDETLTSDYTISVTLKNDFYSSYWYHLFGTYIDYAGFSPTNRVGPMLYGYHEGSTTRYLWYSGRWDNTWNAVDLKPENVAINKNRYSTITAVYSYEQDPTENAYMYHTVRFYLNGEFIGEARSSDYYAYLNFKDKTDGWIHMLCCPKKTVSGNDVTYTYGVSSFAGNLYSARLYDHALTDQEVNALYNDDYSRYMGSGSTVRTVTLKGLTADSNGVISINGLTGKSIPKTDGTLKVSINNNVANLNYVRINDAILGLSVRDAESSTKQVLDGYSFENKKLILDSGMPVTQESGNTVTWYRSVINGYHGYEIEANAQSIYVNMTGYYYAIINGQLTPIIYLKNDLCWPVLRSYWGPYVMENSEGYDYKGDYNSTTDKLINGGITVSEFVHAAKAKLGMMTNSVNTLSAELPNMYVYASGVDTLTLELSSNAYPLTVKVITDDGLEVINTKMNARTLSFKYDFQTPFKVEWTDGNETSVQSYKATDVRSTISTYDRHYYYLTNSMIESDEQTFDYTGAHIYKDEALLADGRILNLRDGSISEGSNNFKLVPTTPLFNYDYDGSNVDVYYSYSVINKSKVVEGQIIVKGEDSYTLTPAVSNQPRGILVDEYAGKKYLTVINEEQIVNLYDKISVPAEFKDFNVKEISCSLDSDDHILLVRYGNGTLVGFNYLTGAKLDLFSTLDQDFLSYLRGQLNSIFMSNTTSALEGSYRFATSQMTLLSGSAEESVLSLFASRTNDAGNSDADGTGDGDNPNETVISTAEANDQTAKNLLTVGNAHGVDLTIAYEASEGRFVIKESTIAADIADYGVGGNTSIVEVSEERKNLQSEVDEIAESGVVPGLSKGIVKKTTTVTTKSTKMVSAVFGLIIAAILSILIVFVIRRSKAKA